MPLSRLLISPEVCLKLDSLNSSFLIASWSSSKPLRNSSALFWESSILFKRNDSSISCSQVGQTLFSEKNLCSLTILDIFCVILPLIVLNSLSLSEDPLYDSSASCCAFTSSSRYSVFFIRLATSSSSLSIFLFLNSIFDSASFSTFCMNSLCM